MLDLDGSAFVEVDGSKFFIRPPYKSQHRVKIDQSDVEKAILNFGFSAADFQFFSWSALINHLNELVKVAREKLGEDIQNVDIGLQVIDAAPPQVVSRYLDKIEAELLPAQQLDQAQSTLFMMLKSDNVMKHKELRNRVGSLIETVTARMKTSKSWRSQLEDSCFDSLQRSGQMEKARSITKKIYFERSIWSFAR